MPLNAWWLARIAWIDPVNVPAFLKMKIQTEISLASWGDPLILRDKINRAVRDSRRRSTRARQLNQDQHEQQDKKQFYDWIPHLLNDPQYYLPL